MTILVDTQCWLWMTSRPERFSATTRARLEDPATTLLLSAASAWEMAIKHALGKLRLPSPPADYIASRLRETRTTCLPVSCAHAGRVADLPHHHRDPFDRLLVAQAQVERVRLLTADAIFARYDVETMPA